MITIDHLPHNRNMLGFFVICALLIAQALAQGSCGNGGTLCQGQCCLRGTSCICNQFSCHCGYDSLHEAQTSFELNENKKFVDDKLTLMTMRNGVWQIAKTVPSKDAVKGQYALWPTAIGKDGSPTYNVMRLEHANVTASRGTCCIGVTFNQHGCSAQLCCGGGCCC